MDSRAPSKERYPSSGRHRLGGNGSSSGRTRRQQPCAVPTCDGWRTHVMTRWPRCAPSAWHSPTVVVLQGQMRRAHKCAGLVGAGEGGPSPAASVPCSLAHAAPSQRRPASPLALAQRGGRDASDHNVLAVGHVGQLVAHLQPHLRIWRKAWRAGRCSAARRRVGHGSRRGGGSSRSRKAALYGLEASCTAALCCSSRTRQTNAWLPGSPWPSGGRAARNLHPPAPAAPRWWQSAPAWQPARSQCRWGWGAPAAGAPWLACNRGAAAQGVWAASCRRRRRRWQVAAAGGGRRWPAAPRREARSRRRCSPRSTTSACAAHRSVTALSAAAGGSVFGPPLLPESGAVDRCCRCDCNGTQWAGRRVGVMGW